MLRKAIFAGVAAVVGLALPVLADVGDLKPVACPAGSALMSGSLDASAGAFAEAPEGCGTVNPHAVVVTLRAGEQAIKVAIDSSKPDAGAPDLIRVDFSGAGKFADAVTVPLRIRPQGEGYFYANFGPATVSIRRDGKTIPALIEGSYSRSSNYRYLHMYVGTGLEGQCAFGDKTCPVRIIDGNSNFRFDDKPNVFQQGGQVRGREGGPNLSADTLIVDTGAGLEKSAAKSFYGQPALVGGVWYEVTLSEDGAKISARPAQAKTGTIRISQKHWTAKFIGTRYVLVLSGTDEPVAVPADSYVVGDYQITFPGEGGSPPATLMGGRMLLYGQAGKVVEVPAGQTVTIPIGPPLTGSVRVSQSGGLGGRTVNFSLELTDAAGASVDNLTLPGGSRPPEPRIEIFDKDGKSIYSGNMEYG